MRRQVLNASQAPAGTRAGGVDQQATSRDGYHPPARQPKRSRPAAAPYPISKSTLLCRNGELASQIASECDACYIWYMVFSPPKCSGQYQYHAQGGGGCTLSRRVRGRVFPRRARMQLEVEHPVSLLASACATARPGRNVLANASRSGWRRYLSAGAAPRTRTRTQNTCACSDPVRVRVQYCEDLRASRPAVPSSRAQRLPIVDPRSPYASSTIRRNL